MNPANWLDRSSKLYPDCPAILLGTEVVSDYKRFRNRAAALGQALKQEHGVSSGDHIVIYMKNCVAYLEVMYAAWFVGAVIVPVNAKLHVREAAWIIQNSDAKILVCDGESASQFAQLEDLKTTDIISVDDPAFEPKFTHEPLVKPAKRDGDDVAWLFYTSGTTGRPKGVMITNANIQTMALAYFANVDSVEREDASLYAAPMSHGAGLYNVMFVMSGARHVVPVSKGFDPSEIEGLARQIGNICMFAAPTMIRRMLDDAKQSGYRGEGLKTVVYGGGPMYVADIVEAVEIMGPRFVQIYGQGESPMTITALSRELIADRSHPRWRDRLASVGVAQHPVDVKIADENGKELPNGQIGEILVAGTSVMKGYWHNEAATNTTLKGGWLWTGDLGEMDEDGFITLRDRSKDVIISGGTNIYPREVEEILLAHPGVSQVSVVGKPDREWGEIVVAYVVLENGHSVDDGVLDAHCNAMMARFKRPKQYVYLPDLPKNAYGKVLKTALREQL